MNNKEILLLNDIKKEYKICAKSCKIILRANQLNTNGFIFYRYFDFNELFSIREQCKNEKKIKLINLIYPSSKQFFEHPYESFWVDINSPTVLNIVTSFALVYISNSLYLHTLPVWESFLRKIIRLFRGIRVSSIRF
jgi:hypothetical protein